MSVSLLNDTLPIDGEVCTSSVRRQLHRVAARSESELGQELTVGLDGEYVRGHDGASRSEGHSMRWTERGAHLLLQVRTMALNDELRSTFERWHPEMKMAA